MRTLSPNLPEIAQEPNPKPTAEINPSNTEDSNSDNNSEPEYIPINP